MIELANAPIIDVEEKPRKHRDTFFDATARSDSPIVIDEIHTALIRLVNGEWWIVANEYVYDDIFEDIGPFDDVEVARIHQLLLKG